MALPSSSGDDCALAAVARGQSLKILILFFAKHDGTNPSAIGPALAKDRVLILLQPARVDHHVQYVAVLATHAHKHVQVTLGEQSGLSGSTHNRNNRYYPLAPISKRGAVQNPRLFSHSADCDDINNSFERSLWLHKQFVVSDVAKFYCTCKSR